MIEEVIRSTFKCKVLVCFYMTLGKTKASGRFPKTPRIPSGLRFRWICTVQLALSLGLALTKTNAHISCWSSQEFQFPASEFSWVSYFNFFFFFWLWVGLALSEEIFSSGRSRNIIAWITALISQKTWQRMWLLVCAVDSSSLPNPQSFTFCFALAFHGLCHRYRSDSNRSSGPCASRIFGPGCANVFFLSYLY